VTARQPAVRTLAKYGLTLVEWQGIMKRQGGGCGVCGVVPASGTLHIDHEHVRLWRRMKPSARRKYVRGVACWKCNSVWLRRGATPELLRAAAKYLAAYERRRR
jgi:hypothetical protein